MKCKGRKHHCFTCKYYLKRGKHKQCKGMSKHYFHFADLMRVNVFSLDFREIQRKVFTATAQVVKAFSPSSKSCHLFSPAVKPALKLQV